MSQIPGWLAITQSTATTVGVLIALWVAGSNVRKNREEREDRGRQLAALERAEDDRVAAQARKMIPAAIRQTIFGPNMWTVKLSNLSSAAITDLDVRVLGVDADGRKVEGGCEVATDKLTTTEAFRRVVSEAVAGSINGAAQAKFGPSGVPGGPFMQGLGGLMGGGLGTPGPGIGETVAPHVAPRVSEALQQALTGQLASEWPTTLTPNQDAVMGFSTSEGVSRLSVRIRFTDEAGYRWVRTDSTAPRRLDPEADPLG